MHGPVTLMHDRAEWNWAGKGGEQGRGNTKQPAHTKH